MSQDRPDMQGLLEAVYEYLESRLLPELSGDPAFQVRVCINLLRIVEREPRDAPVLEAAGVERLRGLLAREGSAEALNRELSAAIRSGTLDWRREDLRRHLMETARDKLRIVNPRYLDG